MPKVSIVSAKPILVHAHVFYPQMWSQLKSCIQNIAPRPFDLYVTLVENHQQLIDEIKADFPQAHIEIVENRGFDIGPFIEILHQVNLDNYSYIVKLHTKRDIKDDFLLNSYDISQDKWRTRLLKFISSPTIFAQCLQAFNNDKHLGMINDYHLIMSKKYDGKPEIAKTLHLLKKYHIDNPKYQFVAGSMFICRADLLKKLQSLPINLSDFAATHRSKTYIPLANIMERFIGCLIVSQGYKIADVYTPLYIQILQKHTAWLRAFGRFLYRKKTKANGSISIKICKIQVPSCLISNKNKLSVYGIYPIKNVLKNYKNIIQLITNIWHPLNKRKRKDLRQTLTEKFQLQKVSFSASADFDVNKIPLFIISYNRLSYLKQMVEALENLHLTNIHIVDNASNYEPLLEYLAHSKHIVHHMDKNYGHNVLWDSGLFEDIINNNLYIVSDPDIELNPNMPNNFIFELYKILGSYPSVQKVGLALKIDDLPTNNMTDIVKKWEKQFWQKRLKNEHEMYFADIDTTFALYRPGKIQKHLFYKAIRVAGNFTAKHLPWYGEPQNLEQQQYKNTASQASASWCKDINRYTSKIGEN